MLRKTVGKPQAVMWNKCHMSVCTKKYSVLSWKPALQTWADGVSESSRLEGSPVVGGWHPSPTCWVSAPGGQGHSLGGCWQVCSPDDISSPYWSFYSCSCGPAYSRELGLALCARVSLCCDMVLGAGGVEELGGAGTRVADGKKATGTCWWWLMCPVGSWGWT